MKKLLSVIICVLLISLSVYAQGETYLKLKFNSVPETPVQGSGWINIKDIIDSDKEVSVTVFNGGEDAVACFISGRNNDWATVCATEQIYIESGESETLVLSDVDVTATKFMLEFRELYQGAEIYLRGKDADYSKITTLSSDLGDHFVLSCGEISQVTATPEPTETPEVTQKPTAAPEKTATVKTPETTEKAKNDIMIYEPADIYVTVTTLVVVALIAAFAGMFAGGLLVAIVLRKNKKG